MDEKYNLKYIWLICLVAAMGGLLFGYDWVVIGGAKPFYEAFFGLTGEGKAFLAGWAMSSALAGCLVGAMISGFATDRFGRKKVLIVAAVMFTVSAVWTALAGDYNSFVIARIIGGIGIGLASNVSPIYIAEMSPPSMRGKFVSINQLTIVIGVFAAQLVNLGIGNINPLPAGETTPEMLLNSWNGQHGWRWMFAAEAIPAVLFFLLALVIPESPRWLLQRKRTEQARAILTKIGGEDYAAKEMADVAASLHGPSEKIPYGELFRAPLFKVLLLGIFLAVLQQWCGINVIFNYAEEVFKAAGYGVTGMLGCAVLTGAVNLIFTFVAIAMVDRWGRRPLMLMGSAGLTLIYAILGTCYFYGVKGPIMVIIVLAAIAVYAMTFAPIVWVLISEIFPNRIRGAAVSISVSALWISCFGLTFSFPPINAALGASGTFWLYGAICLAGFVVIRKAVPETKGRTLEEIERELGVE
jgi:sugar porter (SP) family MFS transporter